MTELFAIPLGLAAVLAWDGWRRYLARNESELRKDMDDLRDVVGGHTTWIKQQKQQSLNPVKPGRMVRR